MIRLLSELDITNEYTTNECTNFTVIQDPVKFVRWSNVVGGEAALWTEQAGDQNAMTKIFPRAYALAERYWSDPTTGII